MLSSTVSSTLNCYGGDEASETSRFTAIFDKFFDCLNVRELSHDVRSNNPFKAPYRSGDDFRLQVQNLAHGQQRTIDNSHTNFSCGQPHTCRCGGTHVKHMLCIL